VTVAQLGIKVRVDGASQASVDLDKLDASSGKAEKGAGNLGRASKELSGSLQAMTAILQNIERHTAAMAAAQAQAATATARLGAESTSAAAAVNAAATATKRMETEQRGAATATAAATAAAQRLVTVTNAEAAASRELASALNAEQSAAMAAATAMNARAAANDNRNNGSGYTSNIAAQFQDIGVTAAMGMSPLQIALQQGTQLSAVFNDLRTQGMGVGATLAAAFTSIVNPVSLVTLGVVGASAALIQYLSSASEVNKLDETLKTHAANVSALREAYGEALNGATTYARESNDVIKAATEASANAIRTSLKSMTSDIASSLDSALATAPFEAAFAGYEQFSGAIKSLSAAAKAGEPGIVAFRQQVVAIAAADPSNKLLQELRDRFLEMTKAASGAELAVEGSNRVIAETARIASGAIAAVQGYRDALTDLSKIALPPPSPIQMADEAYGRAIEGATSPGARAAADAEYLETVTRIKEREAEKQAEIDKRKGEQNAERLIREGMQQEEALARRVEMHQWAIMSEEDAENLSLQKRLEDLEAYYEQGKMSLEEYNQWKLAAEEDHARQVDEIKQRSIEKEIEAKTTSLRVAGDLFGSLASLANAFGEKGFLAAKAFSIAQAVMNTAEGITKAYATVPPPWNVAAAAAVAIAGAAQIATIASTKPGSARTPTASGGGGGYGASGGGSTSNGGTSGGSASNDNALGNTMYVQINGEGPVSQEALRDLMDMMVEAQKDGYRLVYG
jgi:hypothetical protein